MDDKSALPQGRVIRDQDFINTYANNVGVEPTAWDLKMIFGQLELSQGVVNVEQHAAVTMAWSEAKVFAFMLLATVKGIEAQVGEIKVPLSVRPPRPAPPSAEAAQSPNAQAAYEDIKKLYDQMFPES